MKRVFYILATLFIVAQAAWADQTVTMEDGLRYAVTSNQTVTLAADNKLYYPNDAMTIGAFRAYFQLANGITAGDKADFARIVLNFGDDESTQGVTTPLSNRRGTGGEAWYALDGRRLMGKPAASGLYIHNGRKVIIK